VIEEKPVEAELLIKQSKSAKDLPRSVSLGEFKRFEGPFQDDTIDRNQNRPWDPIGTITVELRPPAPGQDPPSALGRLVREIRETAALAKPAKGAKPPSSRPKAAKD
jgi:hypothetical protein